MRRLLALLLLLPVLAGCGKKRCAVPECGKEADGDYCRDHAARWEGTVEEIFAFGGEESQDP